MQASLLAGCGLFVFAAGALAAPATIGQRCGSREPNTCSTRKAPASGALSSAQAMQYFLCYFEKDSGETLNLAANVKIEVSKGRPFNRVSDSFTEVDPSQTVTSAEALIPTHARSSATFTASGGRIARMPRSQTLRENATRIRSASGIASSPIRLSHPPDGTTMSRLEPIRPGAS